MKQETTKPDVTKKETTKPEIIKPLPLDRKKIRTAVFDFDGTISTLRCGWEQIMEEVMIEFVGKICEVTEEIRSDIKSYIDRSAGIQTIFQMDWFVEYINKIDSDKVVSNNPWFYKDAYNERLMQAVNSRRKDMDDGILSEDDYLIKGARDFIIRLRDAGVSICVASGTDDPDVQNEARVLGMDKYFDLIKGAPVKRRDCSKEAVLRDLIESQKLSGSELLVVGDGKVEIMLGNEYGAITLGAATDETSKSKINLVKRDRLISAGAHAITGDFTNPDELMEWLGF